MQNTEAREAGNDGDAAENVNVIGQRFDIKTVIDFSEDNLERMELLGNCNVLTPSGDGRMFAPSFHKVTNSSPGKRGRLSPIGRPRDNDSIYKSQSDDVSTDIEASKTGFDYGGTLFAPDVLLSALETSAEKWLSPSRIFSPMPSTDKASWSYRKCPGDYSSGPMNQSSALQLNRSFSYDNDRTTLRKIHHHRAVGLSLSWLLRFLGDVRRRTKTRRLTQFPCLQPHCAYSSQPWDPFADWHLIRKQFYRSDLASDIQWMQVPLSLVQLETLLTEKAWRTSVALEKKISYLPDTSVTTYQYSLIKPLWGEGGTFGAYDRLGRRMDRIETRRRELGAILPYNAGQTILSHEENDPSWKVWQAAFLAGYCAWRHYAIEARDSTPCKQSFVDPSSQRQHPRIVDGSEQSKDEPSVASKKREDSLEQRKTGKKRKTGHSRKCQSSETVEDTMTTAQPEELGTLDLSRVLLEEKSRRLKARNKELALLQRFGLCTGQSISTDSMQTTVSKTLIKNLDLYTNPMPGQKRSGPQGPPLRCGSPSSFNLKLKRKREGRVHEKLACREKKLVQQSENFLCSPTSSPSKPTSRFDDTSSGRKSATDVDAVDCKESLTSHLLEKRFGEVEVTSPLSMTAPDFDDASSYRAVLDLQQSPIQETTKNSNSKAHESAPVSLKRRTPLIYDEDGLSESARKILQALENKRFERDRSNSLPAQEHDSNYGEERPASAVKLFKQKGKKLRKEAKKKRRKSKRDCKAKERKRSKVEGHSAPLHLDQADSARTSLESSNSALNIISDGVTQQKNSMPVCDLATKTSSRKGISTSDGSTMVKLDLAPGCMHVQQNEFRFDDTIPLDVTDSTEEAGEDLMLQRKTPPVTLFCSERFMEQWSSLIAAFATGTTGFIGHSRTCFIDTPLLDRMGVDIETQADGGIIILLLSHAKHVGFSNLLRHSIDVAASSRFATLDIFLCADEDHQASLQGIAKLQTAAMRHNGTPRTYVSFQLVSPSSLPGRLAESIITASSFSLSQDGDSSFGVEMPMTEKTKERLIFLLTILPSLSVGKAMRILRYFGSNGGEDFWLQSLFEMATAGQLSAKGTAVDHHTMQQLAFVLSTSLGV